MNVSRLLKTIIFPPCMLIAAGCSPKLVPFTHDLREQYDISAEELHKLQFFVSGDITLQHYMSSSEAGVTPRHKYRVINNSLVEEVKINTETPGIAESVGDYSLRISFDSKKPECILEFGNVNMNGNYSLFARNWNDYIGDLDYCGREFQAVNGSNNAHLLIDYAVLAKFKKNTETVKGRKFK